MIIGNPTLFAIESEITTAYHSLHFLALGYFSIHIQGQQYGVIDPYATYFGNSVQEVEKLLKGRGKHNFDFVSEFSAANIADAYRIAIYETNEENADTAAIQLSRQKEFRDIAHRMTWAPDGDTAFDDSSYILHVDIGDHVRLIGFRWKSGGLHDPATLSDLWIPANEFYDILQQWLDRFHNQWSTMQKTSTEGLPTVFKVDPDTTDNPV